MMTALLERRIIQWLSFEKERRLLLRLCWVKIVVDKTYILWLMCLVLVISVLYMVLYSLLCLLVEVVAKSLSFLYSPLSSAWLSEPKLFFFDSCLLIVEDCYLIFFLRGGIYARLKFFPSGWGDQVDTDLGMLLQIIHAWAIVFPERSVIFLIMEGVKLHHFLHFQSRSLAFFLQSIVAAVCVQKFGRAGPADFHKLGCAGAAEFF